MHKLQYAVSVGVLKLTVFNLCLLPIGLLTYQLLKDQIIGDQIEIITDMTGQWTMRFLLLTLSITPIRRLLGIPGLIKFRRMLGLFAFFYATCHFLVYLVFDQFFDFKQIWFDMMDKKYLFAGILALLLMLPLALTSTNKMIKRLGGKAWRRLHQLIYIAAISAVVHYIWLVKADLKLPSLYAGILILLLSYRIWIFIRNKTSA